MKKKIMVTLLASAMVLCLAACGEEKKDAAATTETAATETAATETNETNDTSATSETAPAETQPEADADVQDDSEDYPLDEVGEHFDYLAYEGDYADSTSERATATVTAINDGAAAVVVVSWGTSANETTFWTMTVSDDGITNQMSYSDCIKEIVTFDDDGNETTVVEYTDGVGYFEAGEDALSWAGAAEESCQSCFFQKIN